MEYKRPSQSSRKTESSLQILARLKKGTPKDSEGLASYEIRKKHRSKLW